MASRPGSGYRSASTLAFWAALLTVVLAVIHVLAALSLTAQIQLLDAARAGIAIPPAQADAHDARQRLLGTIELTLVCLASVALLVWVYRANRNAHKLGAEGMVYSPGWSVGWFLVPLASLVMPYFVLAELWKASAVGSEADWRRARASPVLGVWWALCFAQGVIRYSPWPFVTGHFQLAEIPQFGPLWLGAMWEFSWGLLIAEIVGIAADVLTVVVIVTITDFQERRQMLLSDLERQELAATA